MLVACDETNSLWSHPADRPRPKQLTIPTRFLEKNLWLSLEQAVNRWEDTSLVQLSEWQSSLPLTEQPMVHDGQGSIYVFDGPARNIVPALKIIQPGAVVTALPRPNQAFWTLSALWTGWLWGREAAASFKSVLRRRRYDWNWHSEALQAAMKPIASNLPLNTPIFAILAEPEPAFLTASLVAAAEAGLDQEGIALRGRGEPVQITWRRKAFGQGEKKPEEIDPQVVKDAIHDYLTSKGEPASYLHIHAACLAVLETAHLLYRGDETISYLHTQIQKPLSDPEFQHYSVSPNVETGVWSLANWQPMDTLSDKVEIALVDILEKNPGISSDDLENDLYLTFPGLFTPSLELIQEILKSYAVENNQTWILRQEDSLSSRLAEMETAFHSLENLAPRLGFSAERGDQDQHTIRWVKGGELVYCFTILPTAATGRVFHAPSALSGQSILVIPAERANLLSFKLEHDPGLQADAEKWKVIVYEELESLARQTDLTRETWEKTLTGSRPETPEQMKLF